MLPSPTAEPMAAKMNAVRPEKAPRSALGATAPADGDVALMEGLRGTAPQGTARAGGRRRGRPGEVCAARTAATAVAGRRPRAGGVGGPGWACRCGISAEHGGEDGTGHIARSRAVLTGRPVAERPGGVSRRAVA